MTSRRWGALSLGSIAVVLACSSSGTESAADGSEGDAGTASGGAGTSDGGLGIGAGTGTGGSGAGGSGAGSGGGLTDGGECAAVVQQAESIKKPVDVIFVIDNSSSMDGEINQVQDRINDDFAQIIEASGIDYRVIMVTRYGEVGRRLGGSDNPVCIRAPLGASDCADPHNTQLQNNPPRFFHHSTDIESRDSLCKLLEAFGTGDELADDNNDLGNRPFNWTPVAANGWSEFLRPDSFKTFVEITDDDVSCNKYGYDFDDGNGVAGGQRVAQDFDAALLALSPQHFGTAASRNYNWFSIVAMSENAPASEPWPPTAPIQTGECSPGSDGAGTGYQGLSVLTGGLRWPTCRNDDFDAMFQAIAQGVIAGAQLSCEWDIPAPPAGQTFDKDLVNVRFTPGAGAPEDIFFHQSAGDCGPSGGWYYDDNTSPTRVLACDATCDVITRDENGRIDVLFGCETNVQVPR